MEARKQLTFVNSLTSQSPVIPHGFPSSNDGCQVCAQPLGGSLAWMSCRYVSQQYVLHLSIQLGFDQALLFWQWFWLDSQMSESSVNNLMELMLVVMVMKRHWIHETAINSLLLTVVCVLQTTTV